MKTKTGDRWRWAGALGLALLGGCGGSGGGSAPEPEPPQPPIPPAVAGLRCSGPQHTGWCWQAPQPWAPVLHDVVFTDARNGWAVGDVLMRSTDGGTTWQEQALPGAAPLRAIRFVDANDGWLLGLQGGRLWRTRDGGKTWAATHALPLDHATGLALAGSRTLLVNGLKGDALGEPFTLLSDDAAATWRTSASFVSPEFADADGTLWSLADGRYVQSIDGGRSFAAPAAWGGLPYIPVLTGNGGVTAWLSAYDYLTQQFGKLAQQRLTFGGDWAPVAVPPTPGEHWLSGMALFTGGGWALTGDGWALTGEGTPSALTLWRRETGAADWTAVPFPAGAQRYGNHAFLDGRTVWVQPADQAPFLSTDGGRSWVSGFPSVDATDALQFVRRDGGGALLLGYGGDDYLKATERWYRSTDEGRSWRALPGTPSDGDRITGLWMFDAQRGLAATSGGRWLDTSNAGRDWLLRPDSARLAGSLQDLQFTPDGTGWVVGLVQQPALVFGPRPSPKGPLYRSVDQGRTWRAVELPAALAGTVQGLQFVDDRHGFLRAATGCSFRFYTCYEQLHTTSDAGATWRAVGSERAAGGVPPLMRSATQGVLVSPPTVLASSRVFTTNDGGSTWSAGTELPNGYTLTAQRLIAVGDRLWLLGAAQLLSSGDGGRSWAPVTLPLPLPDDRPPDGITPDPLLKDITFADAHNGWIVGRDGLVLATTDGGAIWVRQTTGTRHSLLTARATGAQTAWIGGTSRVILATVSGGR